MLFLNPFFKSLFSFLSLVLFAFSQRQKQLVMGLRSCLQKVHLAPFDTRRSGQKNHYSMKSSNSMVGHTPHFMAYFAVMSGLNRNHSTRKNCDLLGLNIIHNLFGHLLTPFLSL